MQKRTSVPAEKYKPGPGKIANVRSKAKASQGAALSMQLRDRQKKGTQLQDSLEDACSAAMLTEGRAAPGLKKRHMNTDEKAKSMAKRSERAKKKTKKTERTRKTKKKKTMMADLSGISMINALKR